VVNPKSAAKVGTFSLFILILIAFLMVWQSGIFLKATGYQLIGEFENVNGLLDGAVVRYRGYKVGAVSHVKPGPKSIKVYFLIKSDIQIPEGSSLRVVFDGLVGEKYLDIKANSKNTTMLEANAILPGYATSSLADFVDIGAQNLAQSKAILEAIREIVESKEVAGSIKGTFIGMARITDDLSAVSLELRKFTRSSQLTSIMDDIKVVAESLRKTTETLLGDPETSLRIKKMITNLADVSENLKSLTENVEYSKLNNAIDNMEQFSAELKDLIKDQDLKNDLKSTIKESRLMFKRTSTILEGVSYLSPGFAFEGKYYGLDSNFYYLANLEVGYNGANYIRMGLGDELGNTILLNFQGGFTLRDNLQARIGLFNTYPGIGVDYITLNKIKFSLDLFNFNRDNNIECDLNSRVLLFKNLDLTIGFDDVLRNSYQNWAIGFSFHSSKYY
jgi:ABC-type transporter Mla subunit MlaD